MGSPHMGKKGCWDFFTLARDHTAAVASGLGDDRLVEPVDATLSDHVGEPRRRVARRRAAEEVVLGEDDRGRGAHRADHSILAERLLEELDEWATLAEVLCARQPARARDRIPARLSALLDHAVGLYLEPIAHPAVELASWHHGGDRDCSACTAQHVGNACRLDVLRVVRDRYEHARALRHGAQDGDELVSRKQISSRLQMPLL